MIILLYCFWSVSLFSSSSSLLLLLFQSLPGLSHRCMYAFQPIMVQAYDSERVGSVDGVICSEEDWNCWHQMTELSGQSKILMLLFADLSWADLQWSGDQHCGFLTSAQWVRMLSTLVKSPIWLTSVGRDLLKNDVLCCLGDERSQRTKG